MRKYNVKVTASGGLGIATLNYKVEYNGDMKEFQEKTMVEALMRGYTAILHYEGSINLAMCAHFAGQDNLANKIMEYIGKHEWFSVHAKGLKEVLNAQTKEEQEKLCEKWKEEGADINLNQYTNEWCAANGWKLNRLEEEAARYGFWLWGVHDALNLLGFDPDDNEKKRRICENLGLYRTDLK